MIRPTTQRVTGWPNGECVRASYATILGLPIEAVPKFDPGTAAAIGQEQGDLERKWLASIGYSLVEISVPPEMTMPEEVLGEVPEVLHLMSGISPRGYGHRVVGFGGRVLWDPHPSRDGLVSVYSLGFLVPR